MKSENKTNNASKTNNENKTNKTPENINDNAVIIDNDICSIEVYEDKIYYYADEFLDTLRDPEDIFKNKRLIVDMFKYIYRHYLINILKNNHKNGNRYNILQLDYIFQIAQNLAHKYNSNISVLLFCNIVNINRDTINRWKNNVERELTPAECDVVKKWYQASELDLTQGGTVFDIFLLKSNYGYVETAPAKIETIAQIQTADQLPILGLHNNVAAVLPDNAEE